ncbi:MAG: SAM-dependent DNA methyltransferase, partial [Myxococcota bacterium]
VAMSAITGSKPSESASLAGLDASPASTPTDKAILLRGETVADIDERHENSSVRLVSQAKQLGNPDSRIQIVNWKDIDLLINYADSYQGICTGDYPHFGRCYWELPSFAYGWKLQQSTVSETSPFGGLRYVFLWKDPDNRFKEFLDARLGIENHGSWVRGLEAWGSRGVTISQTGNLYASIYAHEAFDNNAAVIIPKKKIWGPAIWAYCASNDYARNVREIDQSLKVTNQTLLKVPFDLEHWQKVADEKYPNGLPEPESDDPTQWLFHGHPANAEPATVLQVAIARLLGYRWPPELDPEMRLSDEARKWVKDCEALNDLTDEDGIVCIPAVRGEQPAGNRLIEFLTRALKDTWSGGTLDSLLEASDFGGKTIEKWLRDAFFKQHLKLFHKRPFIWQIWDGRPDGFSALVNYHKLDRKLLENLTYNYLGDWIAAQKADLDNDVAGAEARLIAAEELQKKLKKISDGEAPYDIFVRWKPLEEQPIGWEPELNDGVRINIRPFVEADVLRAKTGIKWGKDRGKEPESLRPKSKFPWFRGCKGNDDEEERTDYTSERARGREFDGDRWNDLHYTREVKEAERAAAKEREEQDSS